VIRRAQELLRELPDTVRTAAARVPAASRGGTPIIRAPVICPAGGRLVPRTAAAGRGTTSAARTAESRTKPARTKSARTAHAGRTAAAAAWTKGTLVLVAATAAGWISGFAVGVSRVFPARAIVTAGAAIPVGEANHSPRTMGLSRAVVAGSVPRRRGVGRREARG